MRSTEHRLCSIRTGDIQEIFMKLVQSSGQFLHDEEGAVAIEYALLAALIAMAIVAAVGDIGTALKAAFESFVAAFP
jgi:pilus assembly protein Flp/PilA